MSAAPRPPAGDVHHDTRLAGVLATADPITAPPADVLIAMALTFVRGRAGAAEELLLWARYAYTAARVLHGDISRLTLETNRSYRRVLTAQGLTFDAVRLCEDRVTTLQQRGSTGTVLAARVDLALALHDDGQCDAARRTITDLQRHADGSPRDRRWIVLNRAAIAAGCGRTLHAANIVRRNAHLLAVTDQLRLRIAASKLAAREIAHHPVCQHQPAVHTITDTADRSRFWRARLLNAWALEPGRLR